MLLFLIKFRSKLRTLLYELNIIVFILASNSNAGGGKQNSNNFAGAQRAKSADTQALNVGTIFWTAIVKFKGKISKDGKLDKGVQKTFQMACKTALDVLKRVPTTQTKAEVQRNVERASELLKTANNGNTETLRENLQAIEDDLKKFAAADVASGGQDGGLLQQNTANNQGSNDDGSQNEKFVAEMSLQRLNNVEKRADAIFLELRKDQEQMSQLRARLAQLDFRTINYQQLLDLMSEALDLIGKIRRQWDQLANFFQIIATHISGSLKNSLTDFVQPAFEMTQLGTDVTRDDGLDALDDMKRNAGVVKDHSRLLHFLAKSYFDVSSAYLTKPLAGLASLFAAKTDDERNNLRSQLERDTKTSEGKIRTLVAQRKEAFRISFQNRRTELEEKTEESDGADDEDMDATNDSLKLVLD